MQYLHSSEVLSDTVYSRFKDHIINYRFRPGEQLQIPDLAERLRMGKTPCARRSHVCMESRL
jgi:DNA-binding GntR family transcriptional regulator